MPLLFLFLVWLSDQPTLYIQIHWMAAVFCICAAWISYRWALKKIPHDRWDVEVEEVDQRRPIFSFARLIAGLGMIKFFLSLYFKNDLKSFKDLPHEYSLRMAQHSMLIGGGTLVLSVIFLFLGLWLLKRRGWRFTALIVPTAIFIGMIGCILAKAANFFPIQVNQANLILILGLKGGLWMPLIQIAYLSIRKEARFQTKTWSEIILAPLAQSSGSLLMQGLLVICGTIALIYPYIMAASVAILALMYWRVYRLGSWKTF